MPEQSSPQPGPLAGVKVLEMGQLIAGPFAGCVLAYFGAEVIKIESPRGGDPLRNWREVKNGTSFWWRSVARNKKCVTVDLRSEEGRSIARSIAEHCDVVLENFRPGTMEKWGLAPEDFKASNPGLVYARISGYGQTGPYAHRPGFASVCEAIGGFRYVNGYPGEPPVRPNLSTGDTIAAIQAVLGIVLALFHRERSADGLGQVVDVAIYEAVFNLLESIIPEYDGAGVVREPSGSTLTGIVPTGTYPCGDGKYVIIGGNNNSIFKRLMEAMDRKDLADDPRLAENSGRVTHQREVEDAIIAWTRSLSSEEVLNAMEAAAVPAGPIYSVREMFEDPHFHARGLFQTVEIDGEPLKIPAITPMLSETPGRTEWPGPALGSHNQEILGDLLGLSPARIQALKADGVV